MSVSEQQQEGEQPQAKSMFNLEDILRWTAQKVVIPAIILIALWQLIASITGINLMDVANALLRLALEGDSEGTFLSEHIIASVNRVTLGFLLAAITAIPLGIVIGRYRLVDSVLGPVVEAMRPIPPIAWIPLSLLMFPGNVIGSQAFIIWVGAFFPILINTTTGVKRTEPVHIDAAKTLGANERQILGKIVLPSAAPEIFAGLRIGFGIGWMCLVAAEMLRGRVGLGYLIWTYWAVGRTAEVITGMLLIGLIGFLITFAFLLIEKYLLRWRQSVSV
jgi:ABC-type nitrate/sulfonate/bicarbonate transport system permease component